MKIIAAFIVALLCAGCAHEDIPNLAEVEPGVYRGGQPTARGWDELKAMGVRDDIKLNTEGKASDDYAQFTDHIWLHYWPINFWEQTFGEPKPYLDYEVKLIQPGTYIHCSHGQDRTGLIVGLYRVKVERWTKASAYAEMRAHGFHSELRGLQRAWDKTPEPSGK